MKDHEYWQFGWLEVRWISIGALASLLISLGLKAAPPWWFLPVPGPRRVAREFDRWGLYEEQGGYAAHWISSLCGWMLVGAILGLVLANLVIRKKS